MAKGNEFLRVEQLAVSAAKQYTGNLQWMWGDALLGYALSELDAWNNEDRYLSLLQNYCDHYVAICHSAHFLSNCFFLRYLFLYSFFIT